MEKEQTNENSWEFHLTDKIAPAFQNDLGNAYGVLA